MSLQLVEKHEHDADISSQPMEEHKKEHIHEADISLTLVEKHEHDAGISSQLVEEHNKEHIHDADISHQLLEEHHTVSKQQDRLTTRMQPYVETPLRKKTDDDMARTVNMQAHIFNSSKTRRRRGT